MMNALMHPYQRVTGPCTNAMDTAAPRSTQPNLLAMEKGRRRAAYAQILGVAPRHRPEPYARSRFYLGSTTRTAAYRRAGGVQWDRIYANRRRHCDCH